MKTINKRSDARSYSPLSFLGNSNGAKGANPDANKTKHGQIDIVTALTFKPQKNPLNYQKSTIGSNYVRRTRRTNSSALNNTVIHDKNSSFEENPHNLSYVDGITSKNVSYQIDVLQTGAKEKNLKSFNQKHGNTPIGDHKHNNSYGSTLFPLEHPPDSIDSKFPNRGDHVLAKRDERNFHLNIFSRRHNESSFIYPPSSNKQKDDSPLFPKIKNIRTNSKGKDDVKNEKMNFMERTYSLSPYKQKPSKGPGFILNQNQEQKPSEKVNKSNKTQEQFYKTKLPFEVATKVRENRGVRDRGRGFQVISKFETPKTQTQSPTDNNKVSKYNSTVMLHKDQSWGASSIKTNTSQVKGVLQYQYGSSKEIPSVTSLNKSRNNSRVIVEKNDENTCIERRSREKRDSKSFYKGVEMTSSKLISENSPRRELNMTVPKILIEHAPSSAKRTSKRSRVHTKSQYDINDRFQTIANSSATNIFESVDISSPKEATPSKQILTKENGEVQMAHLEVNSPEIKTSSNRRNLLMPVPPNNWGTLGKSESHENVLDDFADKSVLVSIQDQNQSFVSSAGKGHFDEMLETSLISYLDEKEKAQQKSRKEIEITLSMSKHPVFKRSKVVVSNKGINSLDKDPPIMASTNMTNSTYKNESCQLKNEKDEFFQADMSLEKSRTLEVDFNFAEDIKNSGKRNNLMVDQISPNFPSGQAFILHTVPEAEENKVQMVKYVSREVLVRSKNQDSADNCEKFEIVSVTGEEIPDSLSEQHEETPTANSSLIKQSFFNTTNKLNPFPNIEKLEQSFNENPMNSMSSYSLSADHETIENIIQKEQLGFKESMDWELK